MNNKLMTITIYSTNDRPLVCVERQNTISHLYDITSEKRAVIIDRIINKYGVLYAGMLHTGSIYMRIVIRVG